MCNHRQYRVAATVRLLLEIPLASRRRRFGLVFLLILAGNRWGEALQVGIARVDVTPTVFPVLINGGMLSQSAQSVKSPLYARAMVLMEDQTQIAMVVVDSCMLDRPFLDEVKALVEQRCGLPPQRIMISATHTHSAPASMGCLGTAADPTYAPWLREKIAEAIVHARDQLQPAQVGWGQISAADWTAVRHWIRRADRVADDPFGNATVRANMHAAVNWDDVTGPAGPEDPWLTMMAFRTLQGAPLAIWANFSMHYYGDEAVSADYFGLFCEGLERRAAEASQPTQETGKTEPQPSSRHAVRFLAAMSHGCSGDIWRRDYARPVAARQEPTLEVYSEQLAALAWQAYQNITYQTDVPLSMTEKRVTMNYRTPSRERLEWAQRIVEQEGGSHVPPSDIKGVYAREQLELSARQRTTVVLQAIRVGDMAIATTPTETYALTGWKIKLQSPLAQTMVIELANGADGYIPPPEQHGLGGYNTWPARSAGLEVEAEPRIVASCLSLLEQVSGQPRRPHGPSPGPSAQQVLALRPWAYWQLDDWQGPYVLDVSPHHRHGLYEAGIAFFLEGAPGNWTHSPAGNRAPHFAGGRLRMAGDPGPNAYSFSCWCWHGLPDQARPLAGWLFARDRHASDPSDRLSSAERLGLSGSGHLVWQQGPHASPAQQGTGRIERWQWNHVALVRDHRQVTLYRNGQCEWQAETSQAPVGMPEIFVGGCGDGQAGWEGRIDEVVLFDRAIQPHEVALLASVSPSPAGSPDASPKPTPSSEPVP